VTVAASTRALWYLSRGTGVVSLLLLTAVLLLGVLGVARWRSARLPRFVVQGLHRNLTLLALFFIAIHVLTTVADGFAPIRLLDAIVPFASPYRPLWLGLGTVAFDLLLALTLTSLVRVRIGAGTWRAVHWLAYASWPVALVHSLGTGSDVRVGWMQMLAAGCTGAVALAVLWRAAAAEGAPAPRAGAAAAALLVPLALLLWYRSGPGAPGWAARAGTPVTLLSRTAATVTFRPVSGALQGTIATSRPGPNGLVVVRIRAASGGERLVVRLRGAPLGGGGVRVSSSRMQLGSASAPALYSGPLQRLSGTTMTAVLASAAGTRVPVSLRLRIDRPHGRVTGALRVGRIG
jgi:sulfoxide reductase heme-binding subunit YedZ